MDKETYKKELIEELGIHMEDEYSLAPLPARIFANLVITDENGLTFEDCLTKRGASKSSISTSLNLLLQLGMITYFTKSGDRKRYFKVTDHDKFFVQKLDQAIKKVDNETYMMNKVIAYTKKYNPEKYNARKINYDAYLQCIADSKECYDNAIKKLKKEID
ncbi:transcriptional regulator [Cellulophaga baltica]|uniref:GbsR/MarR family transcriptional regulator n=1 Tax=Cellulophaga TaxID=104264 RepID=UPI001C07AD02|nr:MULTISPECIES: transcriptional regulator [Cellulophaga]MBU2995749.1 transcriptional regulator [Cellulophaga baltica]MDO6767143.1 transcriptional regulator [Cellulophaga sp. 1_MG-2023]